MNNKFMFQVGGYVVGAIGVGGIVIQLIHHPLYLIITVVGFLLWAYGRYS
jgi:hypothetical protein